MYICIKVQPETFKLTVLYTTHFDRIKTLNLDWIMELIYFAGSLNMSVCVCMCASSDFRVVLNFILRNV